MLRQGILWLRSRARSSRQIKPMLSLLFHLLTFPFDLKSSLVIRFTSILLHLFAVVSEGIQALSEIALLQSSRPVHNSLNGGSGRVAAAMTLFAEKPSPAKGPKGTAEGRHKAKNSVPPAGTSKVRTETQTAATSSGDVAEEILPFLALLAIGKFGLCIPG